MGEELLPGLVKVMEERLGRFGRPFTTAIVIVAGCGIIAWGLGMVFNFISPVFMLAGRTFSLEIGEALLGTASVLIFFALLFLFLFYVAGRMSSRSMRARVTELETELATLKANQDGNNQAE